MVTKILTKTEIMKKIFTLFIVRINLGLMFLLSFSLESCDGNCSLFLPLLYLLYRGQKNLSLSRTTSLVSTASFQCSLALRFRKRVQSYDLFSLPPNISSSFLYEKLLKIGNLLYFSELENVKKS